MSRPLRDRLTVAAGLVRGKVEELRGRLPRLDAAVETVHAQKGDSMPARNARRAVLAELRRWEGIGARLAEQRQEAGKTPGVAVSGR